MVEDEDEEEEEEVVDDEEFAPAVRVLLGLTRILTCRGVPPFFCLSVAVMTVAGADATIEGRGGAKVTPADTEAKEREVPTGMGAFREAAAADTRGLAELTEAVVTEGAEGRWSTAGDGGTEATDASLTVLVVATKVLGAGDEGADCLVGATEDAGVVKAAATGFINKGTDEEGREAEEVAEKGVCDGAAVDCVAGFGVGNSGANEGFGAVTADAAIAGEATAAGTAEVDEEDADDECDRDADVTGGRATDDDAETEEDRGREVVVMAVVEASCVCSACRAAVASELSFNFFLRFLFLAPAVSGAPASPSSSSSAGALVSGAGAAATSGSVVDFDSCGCCCCCRSSSAAC